MSDPKTVMSEHTLRLKTAMVLYALEKELGDFVVDRVGDTKDLHAGTYAAISLRFEGSPSSPVIPVKTVVESTYLDEIFRFAIDSVSGTSICDRLSALKDLCAGLDIFTIRNAVSHPNRAFHRTYWYRMAAIATDPIISQLKLILVEESFRRAEEGVIDAPPEEWFELSRWAVPNNLPIALDHSITGLVGRDRDIDELMKYLRNPRLPLIAVVARGGVGKTALVLEVLTDIVARPDTLDWLDGVVFVSLKQEQLTSDGIKHIDAASSIEMLSIEIARAVSRLFLEDEEGCLDGVGRSVAGRRLLICIDNLETVLRDAPSAFSEFHQNLPPDWRVLVTSRVAVDAAMTFPIDILSVKATEHLVRQYGIRRGLGRIDSSVVSRIARACCGNPLGARLTIDLLALGNELPESIDRVNKEITEYSYRNLIDALTDSEMELLQCLLIGGRCDRVELCQLLQRDPDDVADAIGKVSKTSLVRRHVEDIVEHYEINDAVRDFLLSDPKNISIRQTIQARIYRARAIASDIHAEQAAQGVSPFDSQYIPADLPDQLKVLCREASRAMSRWRGNMRAISEIQRKFSMNEAAFGTQPVFHIYFAKILTRLRDVTSAEKHFRLAFDLNGDNPIYGSELSRCLHTQANFSEAEAIAKTLWEDGWTAPEKSNEKFAVQVVENRLYPLLYQGGFQDILNLTKEWKDQPGKLRSIFGTFRATSWKRKAEKLDVRNAAEIKPCLRSAVHILDDVYRRDGVSGRANSLVKNVIDDIHFRLTSDLWPHDELSKELLDFVDAHLLDIFGGRLDSNESLDRMARDLAGVDIPDNPFRDERWSGLVASRAVTDDEIYSAGYVPVRVTNVPFAGEFDFPTYLFGEDSEGRSYFLHFRSFIGQGMQEWQTLREGSRLAIKPGEHLDKSGGALPAKEIQLVSDLTLWSQ